MSEIIGQCHRYKGYDISPTNTIGLHEKNLFTIAWLPFPVYIIAAVATQTYNAFKPGNALLRSKLKPNHKIKNKARTEII